MQARQKINLFSLTMIVVSLVIGMGIFRSSFNVARDAQSPTIFFLAWIFGGLIALFGALTFAEIGSRYPVTGGFYKIYSYCYHPALAFMINCIILISNAASVSAVALIGSGYLRGLLPGAYQTDLVVQVVALISVTIFFFINYLGFKMSVRTQNVLMVMKIGIVLFIILGLFMPSSAPVISTQVEPVSGFWPVIQAFGAALIAVSFTYGGYQQTINFGGEVENPKKVLPRGIFFGIAIIVTLYLLTNLAYYNVLGFDGIVFNAAGEESKSDLAARHVQAAFGGHAYTIMSALLFFSVLGYVNVGLMSNPRVMFAMAEDKVLPSFLAKTNDRTQVFTIALPVFTAIAIITLFFAESFDTIINWVIFLDSIGLATAVGAIFILRRKTKHLDGTGIYKMKLYPFMPVVYILAYIFVAISCAIKDPSGTLYGLLLFLGFFPVYLLTRRGRHSEKPENFK